MLETGSQSVSMKVSSASLVAAVLVAAAADALKLPSYIKACSRSDPKFNECALKNGRDAIPKIINGDPKYRIPKLDPLFIEKILFGDGVRQGQPIGLSFSCEKCKLHGLKGTQLRTINFDYKNRKVSLEAYIPKLIILGQYSANGRVLVLPIRGSGDVNLTLNGLTINYNVNYIVEKKAKDNKDYLKLQDTKINFKANGMSISLTNLFNGDKALGDNMNKFLNDNWEELLKHFGPAVTETIAEIVTLVINNIAQEVPYDEIVLK